jgi:hypothetical protein
MTRVYRDPNAASATGLRVLVVGAGYYPRAQAAVPGVPALKNLTSVPNSVWDFLAHLLGPWRTDMALGLLSVDLLLSDPAEPEGTKWPGFQVAGEAPSGSAIDPPTIANVDAAIQSVLSGATPADGLLLLFCGHGFSRGSPFFVASDFGPGGAPWNKTINLDQLKLGLSQESPRTQWLFWDCCADIPSEILDALGPIGTTLVQPVASRIAAAGETYGKLSRFGASSALVGEQAFGVKDGRSRFTEMLIEAIDGAAATKRQGEHWWVNDQGMIDAFRTYAQRHPERPDADFYAYVTPFSTDAPERMRLRRLRDSPHSFLVATARPMKAALKSAWVTITPKDQPGSAPVFSQNPPGERATLCVPLPPWQIYTVAAVLGSGQAPQMRTCWADLPLAEEVEFDAPWPS